MIMGSRSPQRLPGFLTRRLFLRRSGGGVMAAGALAENRFAISPDRGAKTVRAEAPQRERPGKPGQRTG
ncbi:MAG TPA: hypothetical protein VNZ61_19710 [Roseomonas sp.]|nr:hypothetical protein [Roseomonas sp.]